MLTPAQLQQLKTRLQIDEYSLWREYLQILFLKYWGVRRHESPMAFKGGTAIRLLLQGFRFSEDLDFSTHQDGAGLAREIRETVSNMTVELPDLKLDRLRFTPQSWLGRLVLPLPQSLHPITVSLNCSLRERLSGVAQTLLDTPFPVVPYPLITHLPWGELFAEKVRALAMRCRGRDVFDVWFLLTKGIPLDKMLVTRKLEEAGQIFEESHLLSSILKIRPALLRNDLEKFLPESHRRLIPDLPKMLVERWPKNSGV